MELTVVAEAGSRLVVESNLQGRVHAANATGEEQLLRFNVVDGEHQLTITADSVGGTSPPAAVSAASDTTPPPLADIHHLPADDGKVTTVLTISGEVGATYALEFVGLDGEVLTGSLTDGRASISKKLANGQYAVAVVLADAAGNASEPSTLEFAVDIPVPPAPVLTLEASPGSSQVRFTVDGPPLGSVTVIAAFSEATREVDVQLDERGSAQGRIQLDDGENELVATAVDFQGRSAVAASDRIVHVVDTTAPELELIVDQAAADRGTLAYTIITEPGSRVTVEADDPALATTFTAQPGPRLLEAPTGEGTFTIAVTAADEYGNTETVVQAIQVSSPPRGAVALLPGLLLVGAGGGLSYWQRHRLLGLAGRFRRPGDGSE